MSDPCQQEDWLKQLDSKVDKLSDILVTLAQQRAEISHIVTAIGRLEKNDDTIFERLRAVEGSFGNGALKFLWLIGAAVIGAIVATSFGQ